MATYTIGSDVGDDYASYAAFAAAVTPSGDDTITFRKGDTFREQISINASGTSGHVITYGAHGSGDNPKILGSEAKNSTGDWTEESSNIWYTTPSSTPVMNAVFDSEASYSTRVPLKTDLDTQGELWWDSTNSRVYLYSVGNPATVYSGSIELCVRRSVITTNSNDYLTFENLDVRYTSGSAFYVNSDNVTVDTCTMKYCGETYSANDTYGQWSGAGIYAYNAAALTMSDNTISYVWMGLYHQGVGTTATYAKSTISGNTISYTIMGGNTALECHGIAFGGTGTYNHSATEIKNNTISNFGNRGISLSHATNTVVESNTVHTNYGDGINHYDWGIGMGAVKGDQIVRYNTIYNITGNPGQWADGVGIYTRTAINSEIYYNIIYDCIKGIYNGPQGSTGSNDGNTYYNNTTYNCSKYGIWINKGYDGDNKTTVTIKNNICDGGVADLILGDNVTCTGGYNCLKNDASVTTGSSGSTYTDSGSDDLNATDPLLVDPANGNLKLSGSSPCIDEGVDVSLTTDAYGNTVPAGDAPDIGSHEYPAESGPTVYYVDTASDGGDGTTTATTGANAAWDDISDISGLSAGDYVLLKKGCEWREVLTVGTAGSDGSPVTFGSYGTGTDPKLNGSDLVSTWTETSSYYATTDIFADDFDDNNLGIDPAWDDVSGAGGAVNQNEQLEVVVSAGGADKILETISETEAWASFKVYPVSYGDWVNTDYVEYFRLYDVANSRVCCIVGGYNDGGANEWRCVYQNDAGTSTYVWPATPVLDTGAWVEILIHWKAATGVGQNDGIFEVWADESQIVDVTTIDNDTLTAEQIAFGNVNVTGAPTLTFYLDDLKVGSAQASYTNVWQATLNTDPSQVFFDDTLGTEVGSIADLDAAKEWYWNSNVLYVYSTSDPDSAYTSPGVEASVRDYCINGNSKNYITINSIDVEKSNTANILASGTNNIINDTESTYGAALGVSVTGATGSVYDSSIHDNVGDGLSVSSNGGTYYSNSVYSNSDGVVVSGDSNSIYLNAIYDNSAIGLTVSGDSNSTYYDLIYDNGDDGVHVSGASDTLYNLVVEGSGAAGFDVDEDTTIRNCIIRSSTGDDMNIANGKTVTGGYNCFEDAAKAGDGTYTDTGSSTLFSTDPEFTDAAGDDFTIANTSPCINAGVDVGLTSDYAGNTVPIGTTDIGCYETESAQEETGSGTATFVGQDF